MQLDKKMESVYTIARLKKSIVVFFYLLEIPSGSLKTSRQAPEHVSSEKTCSGESLSLHNDKSTSHQSPLKIMIAASQGIWNYNLLPLMRQYGMHEIHVTTCDLQVQGSQHIFKTSPITTLNTRAPQRLLLHPALVLKRLFNSYAQTFPLIIFFTSMLLPFLPKLSSI